MLLGQGLYEKIVILKILNREGSVIKSKTQTLLKDG